jgi:hypothetical protein
VFRPGFGDDVITDYSGRDDTMQFAGFGSARPTVAQVGNDVSIHFAAGDDILLVGVRLSSLTSSDYLWS